MTSVIKRIGIQWVMFAVVMLLVWSPAIWVNFNSAPTRAHWITAMVVTVGGALICFHGRKIASAINNYFDHGKEKAEFAEVKHTGRIVDRDRIEVLVRSIHRKLADLEMPPAIYVNQPVLAGLWFERTLFVPSQWKFAGWRDSKEDFLNLQFQLEWSNGDILTIHPAQEGGRELIHGDMFCVVSRNITVQIPDGLRLLPLDEIRKRVQSHLR